jgi:hypothetical protein
MIDQDGVFDVKEFKRIFNENQFRIYRKRRGMHADELEILALYDICLCIVCWRLYDMDDCPDNQQGLAGRCCPVGRRDDPEGRRNQRRRNRAARLRVQRRAYNTR